MRCVHVCVPVYAILYVYVSVCLCVCLWCKVRDAVAEQHA